MKYLLILLLASSCTYQYTVGIESGRGRYVETIYLKKGAKFDICYHDGHYVLGFFSPLSPKPKQYIGKNITGFEILKIEKR